VRWKLSEYNLQVECLSMYLYIFIASRKHMFEPLRYMKPYDSVLLAPFNTNSDMYTVPTLTNSGVRFTQYSDPSIQSTVIIMITE
jgi:hypothetical protein